MKKRESVSRDREGRERILLVRPSALGDVCRTVPLLVSLRRAYPDATIDWLVQDSFVDAIRAHPDLSEAIPFPRKALGRWAKSGRLLRVTGWARSIRRRRYDIVIDAQGLARSGWITRLTGAATRIGPADAREGAALHYTHKVAPIDAPHTVDRMLSLVEPLGIEPVRDMRLFTPPEHAPAESQRPDIILAPTSRWPGKRWPAHRFAELARALLEAGPWTIGLVGGPDERDQCAPLLQLAARSDRVLDLIGQTPIGGLMGLIEHSRLVVANDSAAIHMAVGFDRPMVALFGPTRIDRVGPYRHARDVIQHADESEITTHKDDARGVALMERISTDEVVAACLARLG